MSGDRSLVDPALRPFLDTLPDVHHVFVDSPLSRRARADGLAAPERVLA